MKTYERKKLICEPTSFAEQQSFQNDSAMQFSVFFCKKIFLMVNVKIRSRTINSYQSFENLRTFPIPFSQSRTFPRFSSDSIPFGHGTGNKITSKMTTSDTSM